MRVGEISLKQLQGMGLNELLCLKGFLANPSEENWQLITLGRLRDERIKLLREKIERKDWPPQFQSHDWEIAVRRSMNLPPMSKDELRHYIECDVLVELRLEREILKTQGVDESLWPENLQGSDWVKRFFESYGLEEPQRTPPAQLYKSPSSDSIKQAKFSEPRTKPKPPKVSNPYADDGFGTLLK